MKQNTLIILLVTIILISCNVQPPPVKLGLAPEFSPSGEEITLTYEENASYPLPVDSLKVFAGKEVADVVARQKGVIRFLLPELPEGTVQVTLRTEGRVVGEIPFKVRAHPTKKILFVWKNGEAQKIGEKLTNDSLQETEVFTKSKSMLYGIYSMQDELLLSGNIDNAMSRSAGQEIFPDPAGSIRKMQNVHDGSFSLLVPNEKTSFVVKIFKPGAILNKNNTSFLPDTHLIQQITIKNN